MIIAVPAERRVGERRVALTPDAAGKLIGSGLHVRVEAGAGTSAGFPDAAYAAAGAELAEDSDALLADADLVLAVQAPAELDRIRTGAGLIAFLQPLTEPELVRALAQRGITAFAMELVPRITRAQRMDALSSQSTAAGYRAALVGATRSGKFFPMLMTAAGTIPPASVLVLGAGVAGLQAIATARRLGAVVKAFDIRPAVKEQVESLGATFVGLAVEEAEGTGGYAKEVSDEVQRREHELLTELVAAADVVITTALIPGRSAPVLITREMVEGMRPGAVIVDLAAEAGGNCELTRAGAEVVHGGVVIVGLDNAPSGIPTHASQMYARNVLALVQHVVREGALHVDLADEITREACVTHGGAVVSPRLPRS